MKVSVVDILCQIFEVSNRRREVLFNYHIDSKEERLNVQASVIFMIKNTQSSMQMGPDDYSQKNTNIKHVGMAWYLIQGFDISQYMQMMEQ